MQHDIKPIHNSQIPVFSLCCSCVLFLEGFLETAVMAPDPFVLRFWCVWGAWQVGTGEGSGNENISWYCWWKKSGGHQLSLVVYPIIYSAVFVYIPGGCLGFLNHQQDNRITAYSSRIIIRIYLRIETCLLYLFFGGFPWELLTQIPSSCAVPTGRCLQCNLWHWWSLGTTPRVSWMSTGWLRLGQVDLTRYGYMDLVYYVYDSKFYLPTWMAHVYGMLINIQYME